MLMAPSGLLAVLLFVWLFGCLAPGWLLTKAPKKRRIEPRQHFFGKRN